jgi:hypothetical protein
MMEKFIEGRMEKMNNNDGYVREESGHTAQAFSHFTHHFSKGEMIVVDVQGFVAGDRYVLTDPAIHTTKPCGHFGTTNLGRDGVEKFFVSHACNSVCRSLALPEEKSGKSFNPAPTKFT